MKKVLENIFIISLSISLLLGFLMVLCQITGLIIQNGDFMISSKDILSKPALIFSAIAGITTFILEKIKKEV